MHQKTVAELIHALNKKEFSAVELTQHYLNRIAQFNGDLNSFITVTPDSALQAAAAADKQRAAGQAGPLCGIPLAHKDIFCTYGIKTTCAAKMLDNFIAPYNATIVDNFNKAGLVMLGKTNMDEFAMGSSNETSYYGNVKNPWDLQAVPGGSSGGSSAAVAAGLAPVATASDTGGSIRQPAALCGITGLKPTYGRVSRYGMIAFASSLDQAGLMARSAEDIALVMNSMAGFDPKDSTSIDIPVPDYTSTLNDSLAGLRIGLPKEYFGEGLDPSMRELVMQAAKVYESLGATLHEISLPNAALSVPVYYVIAPAECSSNLSRFDGVRYGYRCDKPKDLMDMYKRSRGEAFGAEVKRRIMVGTYVLSAGYFDAYYVKAQKIRRLVAQDFHDAFEKVDLILGPVTPSAAFNIGEKVNDPISMYLSDIYTIATNLAGLPGISVPAGFINNRPIGLQLVSNHFTEAKLLNYAHAFQKVTDWHKRVPEKF